MAFTGLGGSTSYPVISQTTVQCIMQMQLNSTDSTVDVKSLCFNYQNLEDLDYKRFQVALFMGKFFANISL